LVARKLGMELKFGSNSALSGVWTALGIFARNWDKFPRSESSCVKSGPTIPSSLPRKRTETTERSEAVHPGLPPHELLSSLPVASCPLQTPARRHRRETPAAAAATGDPAAHIFALHPCPLQLRRGAIDWRPGGGAHLLSSLPVLSNSGAAPLTGDPAAAHSCALPPSRPSRASPSSFSSVPAGALTLMRRVGDGAALHRRPRATSHKQPPATPALHRRPQAHRRLRLHLHRRPLPSLALTKKNTTNSFPYYNPNRIRNLYHDLIPKENSKHTQTTDLEF
jgi:hypothetical protein